MMHPQRQLLQGESEGCQAATAKHRQGAEKRPDRVTEDEGAEGGRGQMTVAGEVEVDSIAREKKAESYSGTSRSGIGTRTERPTRTERFEDEPTVFGVNKVQQCMATDATERDDMRASEAREAELRGRSGEGAGVRHAEEGVAAPPAGVDDGMLRRAMRTSPLDEEEQRTITPTAPTAVPAELKRVVTVSSPTEGGADTEVDPGVTTAMRKDVTTTSLHGVTDTPDADPGTTESAEADGVGPRVMEVADVHGDSAGNDDAMVRTKQDEISQARLARHKARKAAKRQRFRALQLSRRREARVTESERREVEEVRRRQRCTEASEALAALRQRRQEDNGDPEARASATARVSLVKLQRRQANADAEDSTEYVGTEDGLPTATMERAQIG
ncbi:hypothetical protein PF007_g8796 [Phytophthora fragariae]|uniref:Uncharacterized protein n=3 Tax=Phytophthora fragariae TaxID=53985 RepID=A0A6A3SLW0_9STRA|nr:hypothetical protein PF007_g8796 [Phytophthora fragariae]KAE9149798.1 hypothetical protein PF006_g5754 [Phytophthora fragariae]